MVGDGPLLGVCRDISQTLGIDHAVTFFGALDHEQIAGEMRRARAFVQHSIVASDGDSEGTPVAILEAGAAGLPVVATRHAGIADVVRRGETGYLVDEGDVAGMAERMIELARDPALAEELGRNAANHIRRYFKMEQSIRRLSRVLEAAARRESMDAVRLEIEKEFESVESRQLHLREDEVASGH